MDRSEHTASTNAMIFHNGMAETKRSETPEGLRVLFPARLLSHISTYLLSSWRVSGMRKVG